MKLPMNRLVRDPISVVGFTIKNGNDMKRKLTILLLLTASFLLGDVISSTAKAYAEQVARAGEEYVIRKGDTLWRIAEQAYGSGKEKQRIKEANPWVEDKRLIPGTKLRIPAAAAPAAPVPPASLEGELATEEPIEPPTPAEDPQVEATPEIDPPVEKVDPPAEIVAPTIEETPPEPAEVPAPVQVDPVEPVEDPRAAQAPASTIHSDPGTSEPISGSVWNTLHKRIESKTLFGIGLGMFLCYMLLFCLGHAILQGLVVWITSHITFVRNASIRKSFKATFLTETLTLCTLLIVGAVAIMMLYVGTENATAGSSSQLFPLVEDYLGRPAGLLAVAGCLLGLHVLLSLRFIPQIFEIQKAQAFMVVLLGVLVPHLAGFYLVGKKMGFIQA